MNEEWKSIPEYEGWYEINTLGLVRSVDRVVEYSDGREQLHKGQPVSWVYYKDGYPMVNLYKNKKHKMLTIHRLLATLWIPNPNNLPNVLHKDGNPGNCVIKNLYWGTQSQNMYDKTKHKTNHQTRKAECPRGHLLVEPNLRKGKYRKCKACANAQSHIHAHGGDLKKTSDEKYNKIMQTAAVRDIKPHPDPVKLLQSGRPYL